MTHNAPRMYIELMVVELQLHGCSSLKEKRQRLGGLRERFGKQPNVSVCESAYQDAHHQAQWSFVAVALDPTINDTALKRIEQHLSSDVDATIAAVHREKL